MDAGSAGTIALTVAGGLVAAPCIYLLALAIAALFARPSGSAGPGAHRLTVLVPAHNEAEMLPRCLAALRTQRYPAELTRIVVVADNCSDATAEVARSSGAEVMLRDEPLLRGKGRALRWALDRLLTETDAPDAVVVIDADSVAQPELLRGLEGRLAAGCEAVQGEYLVLVDGTGDAASLRSAAFLLFHHTRFAGRSRLGLPCSLVGNGMLLSRRLLESHPWSAFTAAEDLEYSTDLRLAGVQPRFAPGASVLGPAASLGRVGATQRMRWEGGRFHVVRTRLPRLIAACLVHRRWALADAAIDLATPPLGLLALLTLAGGAASAATAVVGWVDPVAVVPWGAALILLVAYALVGLRAAHAPGAAYRALLSTPRFLLAKLGTYARMTHGLGADRWERSERPSEARRHPAGAAGSPCRRRVNVCGVPIDRVDQASATDRIIRAVGSRSLLQVCTVNLQFLISARRVPEVRSALGSAGLNIADGAPVVWLSRLLGHPLPGRVTGVDLVPAVAARAAATGSGIFLVGGARGAAFQAARALRDEHPDLRVCGVYEPPLSALDAIDTEEIVRRLREASADILLVGLGHPKQDLWIARNRERLPVSVAIGVGGTFDLIAGRFARAPRWARRGGFEWLFRLLQEPRRLALRYAACGVWLVGVLLPLAGWQRLMRADVIVEGIPAEAAAPDPGGEVAAL